MILGQYIVFNKKSNVSRETLLFFTSIQILKIEIVGYLYPVNRHVFLLI